MAEAQWVRWSRHYYGVTSSAHVLRPGNERMTRCGKRITPAALLLPEAGAPRCRACAAHVLTAQRQAAGEPPPLLREPKRPAPRDPTVAVAGAKRRAAVEVAEAVRAFRARGGMIRRLPPERAVRVSTPGGDDGGVELPPGYSLLRGM